MKGRRGPANVLGDDRTVVLLRHGTAYYRCHPCHLLKVSQAKKITQKSRKDINDTPGYKKCSSDEQVATENDATDSGDSDENSSSEEDRSCSENEPDSQEGDETVDEETSDKTVDEETSENMNRSDNTCTNSTNTVDIYDSTMLLKPNTFIK